MKGNKEIVQYQGKPCIEVGAVMLPTKDKSNIHIYQSGTLFYTNNKVKSSFVNNGYQAQHLYFTSNEEIKKGDWCYSEEGDSIFKIKEDQLPASKYSSKIIATTDKSLWKEFKTPFGQIHHQNNSYNGVIKQSEGKHYINLPQPSQQFIEAFVKAGGIDKVLVEVECDDAFCGEKYGEICSNKEWKIKTNSHNEIVIHPIKPKVYTTDELKEICNNNPNDMKLGELIRNLIIN